MEVEIQAVPGMPRFTVVGLPAPAVRESLDRVLAALRSGDLRVPTGRVTVNLAPADLRKDGAAFDLPIAVGLAVAGGAPADPAVLRSAAFAGELGLDGTLRPVRGVLPMALAAAEAGRRVMIVPEENGREAAGVEGLEVYGGRKLADVIDLIAGNGSFEPVTEVLKPIARERGSGAPSLLEVRGQENAKRAVEVAAAGGHHLIMFGPPGAGKTMLARRIPGLLPPLSGRERLESTAVHSVRGLLDGSAGLLVRPPFRSPHHTVTAVGLAGGGNPPRPGEISLAHNGVLYLDELPEFSRSALEVLRQPLESGTVTVSRARYSTTYPSRFILVAAMNPCPCGNRSHPDRECVCSAGRIDRYLGRISGPLLDRFDLHVELAPVDVEELGDSTGGEDSETVRARVVRAREIQSARFAKRDDLTRNADMGPRAAARWCELGDRERALLKGAVRRFHLSARAHHRIMKISRTIADLAGADRVEYAHVAEAIQSRVLDRTWWRG